jgi:hypothetical protein
VRTSWEHIGNQNKKIQTPLILSPKRKKKPGVPFRCMLSLTSLTPRINFAYLVIFVIFGPRPMARPWTYVWVYELSSPSSPTRKNREAPLHDDTSHWFHGNSIPKIGCHYTLPILPLKSCESLFVSTYFPIKVQKYTRSMLSWNWIFLLILFNTKHNLDCLIYFNTCISNFYSIN